MCLQRMTSIDNMASLGWGACSLAVGSIAASTWPSASWLSRPQRTHQRFGEQFVSIRILFGKLRLAAVRAVAN